MTSNALFATSNVRSQQKNLVEFKAGKMHLVDKMVHADTRKGLIYIYQAEDALIHFCWKDRTTGTLEDDLIIFPDDCEFKRVAQCDTGRVYILKFKSSTRKFFFWLQDFKTDKDEEYAKRVNEVLNNPPAPNSSRNGGVGNPDGELQSLLTNMSQSQLLQLFGNVGQVGNLSGLLGSLNRPSLLPPSRPGLSTAQSALRTSTTTTNSTSTAPSTSSNSGNKSTAVAMSGPVTEDTILTLLTNRDFANKVKAIIAVNDGRKEASGSSILSKEFEQAARMCSDVLSSGELDSVKEFKCTAEAVKAAKDGNTEDFVNTILQASVLKEVDQESASSSKQVEKRKVSDDSSTSESKKKDDDKKKEPAV